MHHESHLGRAALRALVEWPGSRLIVARVDGEIVGTLTLVTFPIPTGLRAWIEDVVVDEAARGHGVGAALTHAAVELARADGARTVDLTSRPARESANRLYEKLGVGVGVGGGPSGTSGDDAEFQAAS